jgi:hypothetical protein
VLFNMAYRKKQAKALEEAVGIFQVLLERYPASWRGHFFLGETYREGGGKERAIEHLHEDTGNPTRLGKGETEVGRIEAVVSEQLVNNKKK